MTSLRAMTSLQTLQLCALLPLLLLLLRPALLLAQSSDVRIPPVITQSPIAQVTYRVDERIPLECRGTGVGNLQYEWTKNKGPVNLNEVDRLEVQGGGATVILRRASRQDEGFYQCRVSNAYGTVLSNTSHLQLATVGEPASKDIYDQTVLEGQPFSIQAQPHKSFPRPTYSWEMARTTEDNAPQKVILDQRIQMDDLGNLYFAYAKKEDAIGGNIYKLVTFNQYLDQRLGGSYTRITVNPSPVGVQPFQPTLAFPSVTTYVGVVDRDVTLRCFFSANPEVVASSYRWTLPAGSRRQQGWNTQRTELLLRNVTAEDQGNYICSASNPAGRSEQVLQLEVQAAPTFRSAGDQPQNVNATEGQTVSFACQPQATPPASVVWIMNGANLDINNLPSRMRLSGGGRVLTVERVCRDCPESEGQRRSDLMVLQCNASNANGYVLGSGYLNVLQRTVVTSVSEANVVTVQRDEAREVKFQCAAHSDPSTPVSVEWRKQHLDDPSTSSPVYPDGKVIQVNGGVLRLVVDQNATERWTELMGDYTCSANNTYSSAAQTLKLRVDDIPIIVPGHAGFEWWWIILIIALVLLLLIILLCCCICRQRNKGDSYPVDEKERMNGNDPEKEILDNDFQDYKRPESRPLRDSRGSLGSSKLSDGDEGSMGEYGDVDPGKFTEDGSFVGVYTNTADRRRGRSDV